MSPVQQCTGCGGLFPFLPRGLCADCIDVREERFQAVRTWLADNPAASLAAACQATGAEMRLVEEFVREGRLEFSGGVTPSIDALRDREALRAQIAAELARERESAPVASTTPRPRGMWSRPS